MNTDLRELVVRVPIEKNALGKETLGTRVQYDLLPSSALTNINLTKSMDYSGPARQLTQDDEDMMNSLTKALAKIEELQKTKNDLVAMVQQQPTKPRVSQLPPLPLPTNSVPRMDTPRTAKNGPMAQRAPMTRRGGKGRNQKTARRVKKNA